MSNSRCGKLGFRGTHNPQIVSSILASGIRVRDDGYHLIETTEGSPYLPECENWSEKIEPITILNTGGTLTSLPTDSSTGVVASPWALGHQKWRTLMNKLGPHIGLAQVGPKNSEEYLWPDYLAISKMLFDHPRTSWVVIHGTDNISFVSAFLAICARQIGTRVVVVACSKSMDRPTWQGGRLIENAVELLKNVRRGRCYTLGYFTAKRLFVHNPLSIRKFHTTHKCCFDSSNWVSFEDGRIPKSLPRYQLPMTKPNWNAPKRIPIYYLTPLTSQIPEGKVLSYGLGNLPSNIPSHLDVGSRIPNGPYNPLIYLNRQIDSTVSDYSIESRVLLEALEMI